MTSLVVDDVSMRFGGITALDGLSMSIENPPAAGSHASVPARFS